MSTEIEYGLQPQIGNGHQKAFVLAQPKSPEEVAIDGRRKIAPEIRRAVRSIRILAQAKFLFYAILDDTFMYDYGGDGRGRLFASIRDLSIRYGHDRDSITKWAEILRREGVLWFDDSWPDKEWRITALCPGENSRAKATQRIKARASARAQMNLADVSSSAFFVPQNGNSPQNAQETRTSGGNVSPNSAEDVRTSGGTLPHAVRTSSAKSDRYLPHSVPTPSAHLADTCPPKVRTSSARFAEDVRTESAFQAVSTGPKELLETSPDVKDVRSETPDHNVQRCNALKAGGENAQKAASARHFLREVKEVMEGWKNGFGAKELENSGGWWRQCFNRNPKKALMVLKETRAGIVEGKLFSKNPGAHAADLWKRLP